MHAAPDGSGDDPGRREPKAKANAMADWESQYSRGICNAGQKAIGQFFQTNFVYFPS